MPPTLTSDCNRDAQAAFAAAPGSASWVKPTAATPGYHWRWDGDIKDTPTIVRVVEWQSGWLDGRDKPWRTSYLAECFGSMNTSWTMEELEMRGNMLLRLDAPHAPWPNAELRGEEKPRSLE